MIPTKHCKSMFSVLRLCFKKWWWWYRSIAQSIILYLNNMYPAFKYRTFTYDIFSFTSQIDLQKLSFLTISVLYIQLINVRWTFHVDFNERKLMYVCHKVEGIIKPLCKRRDIHIDSILCHSHGIHFSDRTIDQKVLTTLKANWNYCKLL